MKRVISHITATRYEDYNMKSGTYFQKEEFTLLDKKTKVKLILDFFKDANVALVEFIVAI